MSLISPLERIKHNAKPDKNDATIHAPAVFINGKPVYIHMGSMILQDERIAFDLLSPTVWSEQQASSITDSRARPETRILLKYKRVDASCFTVLYRCILRDAYVRFEKEPNEHSRFTLGYTIRTIGQPEELKD